MKAWEYFLKEQEKELGKEIVDKWLRCFQVVNFDACNLYLDAKNYFELCWFKEHIEPKLKKTFYNQNGKLIKVHLRLKEHSSFSISKKKKGPSLLSFPPTSLDPHATFSNFISNQNSLPYKILSKLAKQDHHTNLPQNPISCFDYNPVYIYGSKGTGKSHLLMATAHTLQKRGIPFRYVRADTFTEHVIQAFRLGMIQEFRKVYRENRVLLIDDVHLFARKTATQEELFHTFNYLYTAKCQIIFTAHCPPRSLKEIEDRLISRFEWGITLTLSPLPIEKREEVLSQKKKLFSLSLSKETETFLLETFQNLSMLTRAIKILTLRSHPRHILNKEEIKDLLFDLIMEEKKLFLTPEKLLHIIVNYFGIPSKDILSKSHVREFVFVRQIAMYLFRTKLKMSLLSIGNFFFRDHSTVLSSVKLIEKKKKERDTKVLLSLAEINECIEVQ